MSKNHCHIADLVSNLRNCIDRCFRDGRHGSLLFGRRKWMKQAATEEADLTRWIWRARAPHASGSSSLEQAAVVTSSGRLRVRLREHHSRAEGRRPRGRR